jgi:OMF family outer membrane factor
MKTEIFLIRELVNIHYLQVLLFLFVGLLLAKPAQAQVWTLQQCIDTARVHNKNLQISRNNMEISSQKQLEAIANLIPKVSLNGDYKYFVELPYQFMPQSAFGGPDGEYKEIQMGVPHNINANLQVSIPLYNPQVYGAIQTTKTAMELSKLQRKKTEEQVYYEVSNLYYNAQIIIHQKAFIDSNLINTSKLLKTVQLLNEQLMAKITDVQKVALQLEQLTTQQQLAENNLDQVMNALKFSMGIPFDQHIDIVPDIQYHVNPEYTSSLFVDLQLADTQNELLTTELRTLKNSRFPSVSLYGSYGQNGYGYDQKPDEFLKFYPTSFAGIQVSYPLFNGTVSKRKINQKKIEIQNSELQMALVSDQNSMLVMNVKSRRNITQKNIENTASQLKLATTVYQQLVLQQKEGMATLTDVLMADNELRQVQQLYLSMVVDYLKADLELKKLTGNISFTK